MAWPDDEIAPVPGRIIRAGGAIEAILQAEELARLRIQNAQLIEERDRLAAVLRQLSKDAAGAVLGYWPNEGGGDGK